MSSSPQATLPPLDATSMPLRRLSASERALLQGMVPRELLQAARDEWRARGLTTGDVMGWALSEYLRATNPERAEAITSQLRQTPSRPS